MLLKDLLKNIEVEKITGSVDINIYSIAFDSRKVEKNSLFVAVKGVNTDGHNYILQAVSNGAIAVVYDNENIDVPKGIISIRVKDSAEALGILASNFYENPSLNMKVVGVTGTNGKTTIATLLYHLFEDLGYKCGLLSTVENRIHNRVVVATHTTPDALSIQSLMKQMVDEGCEYCFMEVSSHAISQKRISGIQFIGGIFTNLTHDHLDFHKSFKNYRDTKKQFFDDLSASAFAFSNKDDKNGVYMLQNTKAKKKFYALKSMANYKAVILEQDFHGTLLSINGKEVWIRLIGKFNVYNILAIYGGAVLLGVGEDEVLLGISKLNAVKGRLETIKDENGRVFIIDYAHTPDALKNVLLMLNEMKSEGREIITVFGAGGDRDKTKRPEMGEIAVSLSDKVIITSDNPRSEDPDAIINDIKKGIKHKKDLDKTLVIPDREVAIKTAILIAKTGDIVLIAGKGHEEYQEINGVRHHFSDREVVEKNIVLLNK